MARRTALLHAAACGVTAALLAAGSLTAQAIPPLAGDDVVSVRVQFGITDTEPQTWDGSVEATGGEVLAVRNWSVHPSESVDGNSWTMATREGMNYPRRVYQWEDPLGTVTYLLSARHRRRRGGRRWDSAHVHDAAGRLRLAAVGARRWRRTLLSRRRRAG